MRTNWPVYREVQVVSVKEEEGISNFSLFDFYLLGYGHSFSLAHSPRHQYPAPYAFPMGGVAETRKAPSNEGLLS